MTQKTGPIKPKYKYECVASHENNTKADFFKICVSLALTSALMLLELSMKNCSIACTPSIVVVSSWVLSGPSRHQTLYTDETRKQGDR
jgi:hypothetical protein